MALVLAGAAGLAAQDVPLPSGSIKINLPPDSPVSLLSMTSDQSRVTARGNALQVHLDMSLVLRNGTQNRIRGVTLRLVSQEVAMGGKGAVTVLGMNIGPNESFPIHIETQLMRPTQVAGGHLVQIDLDGVIFQGLAFYGPNRLDSRRALTAYEMEAQRDREYFKSVLASAGKEGLKREILGCIDRQSRVPSLDVRVHPGAVTNAAVASEHPEKFAFLQFPDSPVEPVEGWAQIAGSEARAPRIEVHNRSARPIKHVELGWVVSDFGGRQYMAASVPSTEPTLYLPPGSTARVLQDSSLKFSSNGQPVNIQKMTGFISQVEFADGKVWVPNRQNLAQPLLQQVLSPSPEEQRLTQIYLKKGPDGLIEELKKF